MTYQEFKNHILTILQENLAHDAKISIQDITKNNDTHLDGLTVFSGGSNISPAIYLNNYYEQFRQGRSLQEICDDILGTYLDSRLAGNIDLSFFTIYDNVKPRIVPRLINYQCNRELLQTVPHRRFLDLAIVFHCMVKSDTDGAASILIQNRHLAFWNITDEELYALALENAPSLLPPELYSMADVLKELSSPDSQFSAGDIPAQEILPLYLLSSQNRLHGAICMLYPGLLSDFSARLGCSLYLLPSSIHEVLILPATYNSTPEDLADMVKEVNATQLSPEEILSDHVYCFSAETGKLSICGKSAAQ